MSELRNNASSHENRPTRVDTCGRNRVGDLAVQSDLMLAHYPAYIREQVAELLRVLAEKPREVDGVQ